MGGVDGGGGIGRGVLLVVKAKDVTRSIYSDDSEMMWRMLYHRFVVVLDLAIEEKAKIFDRYKMVWMYPPLLRRGNGIEEEEGSHTHCFNYVMNTWGKNGLFFLCSALTNAEYSAFNLAPWKINIMHENSPYYYPDIQLILKNMAPDREPIQEDVSTCIPDGRSSYARVMIELRADVELKDNIVVAMPRIKGKGYYTCNIFVEYEWKPPKCACCKVFGHAHEDCPKNIGASATKNLKKTSQTPKGILVGQKMGFKPKQVFQPVSKKSTANTCGKKKNNSKSTKEVSKSNPFEVLTSVDNDADLGKFRFVDDDGNPLVPMGIVESDSEVEVFFDETANLRISTSGKDGSDKGYDTNSLLEQWMDSYPDNDNYDHMMTIILVVSSYGVVVLVMFAFCLCNSLKGGTHPHPLY
ncbi:transposon ty3-G gag-pol polyprotein [Tanacetum coccineum]